MNVKTGNRIRRSIGRLFMYISGYSSGQAEHGAIRGLLTGPNDDAALGPAPGTGPNGDAALGPVLNMIVPDFREIRP